VDDDEPTQPVPIIRPARPRPPRRRIVTAASAVALGVAVAGVAFALGRTEAGNATAARPGRAATTITTVVAAAPSPPSTTTRARPPTAPAPTVTILGVAERPTTALGPQPAPATTVPAGSPLPPGTRTGFVKLTGRVEFTPAAAVSGARMSYTATLTNPFDQWVFETATEGLSLYLYTPATEDYDMSPYIVGGVPSSAPELQHRTPKGLEIGLLLAPHASYTFSGQAFNTVESFATSDYVGRADIIFTPPGVADVVGQIVRDAGSFTVLVPPPTTTTSTTSSTTTTSSTDTTGTTR
jgi:hypothetical protein